MTLAEYLATDCKPDCEYLDGEVVPRNAGYGPHSYTLAALGEWFCRQQKRQGVVICRVPDLCVIRKEDFADIIRRPPLFCVEILSPDDRWSRLQESIDDYLQFGVPEISVIDPKDCKAWTSSPSTGLRLIPDNTSVGTTSLSSESRSFRRQPEGRHTFS